MLEELPDCFPKQLHHFTIPLAVYEGSDFFHIHCSLLPTAILLVPVERKYATSVPSCCSEIQAHSSFLRDGSWLIGTLFNIAFFRRLDWWFQYPSRWLFQYSGLLVLLPLFWLSCFLPCLKYLFPWTYPRSCYYW